MDWSQLTIQITPLRLYLLAGLLLHKLVWELLKRGPGLAQADRTTADVPIQIQVIKAVKIAILVGIVVQTISPPLFPINGHPELLTVIGTILYTAGLATALAGRLYLGRNWSDIEVGKVKRDHSVVRRGVYGYIRHPIYVGDLALLLGLELALQSWLVIPVALLVPLVLRKAIGEERKLAASLPGYAEYCRQTDRFIPLPAIGAWKRRRAES